MAFTDNWWYVSEKTHANDTNHTHPPRVINDERTIYDSNLKIGVEISMQEGNDLKIAVESSLFA